MCTKTRGGPKKVIASLQSRHAFFFYVIIKPLMCVYACFDVRKTCACVCSVYLNLLKTIYRKLLKRHLNRGFFFFSSIISDITRDSMLVAEVCGDNPHLQNILHCLRKTKMQMHSHSCSHTNTITLCRVV